MPEKRVNSPAKNEICMKRTFSHFLLLLALWTTSAAAVDLGEAQLRSRIGESLRIEIPLQGEGADSVTADCFRLGTGDGDLPTVSNARLRVKGSGPRRRLVIDQRQAVNEPLIALSLRQECSGGSQRDYLLLPEPPRTKATTAPSDDPDASPPRSAAPRRKSQGSGDRLSLSVAEPAPIDPALAEVEERMLRLETSLHSLKAELEQIDKMIALREEMQATQRQLLVVQGAQAAEARPLPATPATSPRADWLQLLLGIALGGAIGAVLTWHYEHRRNSPRRLRTA